MEKILPVKFKSQWDSDASKTANDCGPTSISMILNYFGENVTTDQVFQKTEAGQGLIGVNQMKKAISAYGYTCERKINQTPESLKALIDNDLPVIALVHHGSLGDTRQDKKFSGGHFFAVVGYRDDGYFVNDPNFKDELRSHGDHHFYPKADFEKAWKDANIDGNQPNSLIVIYRKNIVTKPEETDMQAAELLKKYGIKTIDELDKKIEENMGITWGAEDKDGGGFLGSARRELAQFKVKAQWFDEVVAKLNIVKTDGEVSSDTVVRSVTAQIAAKDAKITELTEQVKVASEPKGILIGKRKMVASITGGVLAIIAKVVTHYLGIELSLQELLVIGALPATYTGVEGIKDLLKIFLPEVGQPSPIKTDTETI